MGYYKALFAGEVVFECWARDEEEFSRKPQLRWYHEHGGFTILGGYA